jgi:hypothetical protein
LNSIRKFVMVSESLGKSNTTIASRSKGAQVCFRFCICIDLFAELCIFEKSPACFGSCDET